MKKFFLSISFAITVSCSPPGLTRRTLPDSIASEFGAFCLNGLPPSMDIRLAAENSPDKDKWIIYLEGGGWCYGPDADSTITNCLGRAGFATTGGIIKGEEDGDGEVPDYGGIEEDGDGDVPDYGGILSSNSTVNPDFYRWNVAFMHYCDGASFAGSRTEAIPATTKDGNPAEMFLRGRNVFDGLVSDLQTTQGMDKATEIILSGGSAGGLAVFYNLDHLAEDLVDSSVLVTGFPDAGFFMDDMDHYVVNFIGADPVWNITQGSGTNSHCLEAYDADERWKCLLAPYLIEHIQCNLYVINSAYDAWQLSNNDVGCFKVPGDDTCDDDSDVQAYGASLKTRLIDGFDRKVPSHNGAFLSSCYVHSQNVNYCSTQDMPNCVGWDPAESGSIKWGHSTSVGGVTPQQAFGDYYFGRGGEDEESYMKIDYHNLQENESCLYKGLPSRAQD